MRQIMNPKILQLCLVLASLIAASTPVSAGEDEGGSLVGALTAVVIPGAACEITQILENGRAVDICVNLAATYVLGQICDSSGTCAVATAQADSDPCPTNGKNDYVAEFPADLKTSATTMKASASCWNHLYDNLANKIQTCKSTSGCSMSSSTRSDAVLWAFS